ncbi:MAG: carbohydrate ABC transporter permease [Anaerolineae bacterium]|nr:carbohydrate ABC transporter permease [Anaerolineae bacterium]
MSSVERSQPVLSLQRTGPLRNNSDLAIRILAYVLLTLLAITMVVPFVWMISTSFKTAGEILFPNFFPVSPTLENYSFVLTETALPRWYVNSLIVALLSTVSVAFFDSIAGFAFAKYQFPGKRIIFVAFLGSLMVPTEMLIIPWYIMSVNPPVGGTWVDTYWGIAFPGVITAAGIFLMRQFMQGVPDELLDAGRIDGVSEFGLYWRIALPLSLAAVGALCIFNFLGNWNAFIWPLIVTSALDMFTLPVGLQFFSSEFTSDWHLVMTGATLSLLPLLTIVIIFQRYIIEGIALTGVKG